MRPTSRRSATRGPVSVPLVPVPSVVPLVDSEQTKAAIEAATVVTTRLWTAAVLLELVDARKGHVVWAGNLQSSAVDDANEPALNGGAPRR